MKEAFRFLFFPDHCVKCLDDEDYTEEMDAIGIIVCEEQLVCMGCGHIKNYWAYGSWEIPEMSFWERLKYILNGKKL